MTPAEPTLKETCHDHSHRQPAALVDAAVNLLAPTAAIALSVTALLVADDPEAAPAGPAPVAAVAASSGAFANELCDQRVDILRC